MLFRSKDLKLTVQKYALKQNFELRNRRSSKTRYEAGCKDGECEFQLRAYKMQKGEYSNFEGFAIAVRLGRLPLCIQVLCFVFYVLLLHSFCDIKFVHFPRACNSVAHLHLDLQLV